MTDYLEKIRKQQLTFKIMMVGESGVGKSCIVLRYTKNTFTQFTNTTLGIDFLQKKVNYKNKSIKLELWDTSGQQRFKATCTTRLKRSNAIFCVYSVSDPKTLDDLINYWIPQSVQKCPKGVVIVVFGNKTDLINNASQIKKDVDERLQKLSQQREVQILSFIGNCKQPQDKGIQNAIAVITEKLFDTKKKEEDKQQQQISLRKKRQQLQKPPERQSIVLESKSHEQTKKNTKKQKKCFFF